MLDPVAKTPVQSTLRKEPGLHDGPGFLLPFTSGRSRRLVGGMEHESETIAEQFDALCQVIEARQEKDAESNEDAWIFWDGYLAAINDLRYIGLKMAAQRYVVQ